MFPTVYIGAAPVARCRATREGAAPCPNVWAICVDMPATTDAYLRAIKREKMALARHRVMGSAWSARLAQEARHARQDEHLRVTGRRSPEDVGYRD